MAHTDGKYLLAHTFKFGKVDYNGSGRKNCAVEVEVELRERHNSFYDRDYIEFTACGSIYNPRHTDCYVGGQCLDTIKEYLPDNPTFNKVYEFWKKYHLNGCHAGTPEQEKLVKALFEASGERYDYTQACNFLEINNLYEVEVNGQPYKYGHAWLCEDIPDNDLAEIKKLLLTADC